MGFEEAAGEGLQENHTRNRKRENLCYVVAKNLAVLVPAVMWKVEDVPNELGETVQEISNRVLKVPSFFPVSYSKIARRERKVEGRSSQQKRARTSYFLKINSKNWLLSKDQI